MQQYTLSILIFTPLVAALVSLFIPSSQAKLIRSITLIVNIVQLVMLIFIWMNGTPSRELVFAEQQPWFTLNLGGWGAVKAEYFVAMDGLSFPLVSLSIVIMFIATISSWHLSKSPKGYFILLLILNAAIIGSFTALDFLLFYLFFEFMLLPMYFLIGIWGGPKREYASIKFFLYTLLGSILIVVCCRLEPD